MPRAALPILVAVLVTNLAFALLTSLVAVRLTLDGFPAQFPAFMNMAAMAGAFIAAASGHLAVRRFGYVGTVWISGLLATATAFAFIWLPPPWTWLALRFAAGLSLLWIWVALEAWLQSVATNASRGRVTAAYMTAFTFAQGAGQFLLDVVDPASALLFILCGVLFIATIVPVHLARAHGPVRERPESLSPLSLFARAPVAAVGGFTGGILTGTALSLTPVFALTQPGMVVQVGLFMTLVLASGALVQWPVGRLSDRMDRGRLLVLIYALLSLSAGLTALSAGYSGKVMLALAILFGSAMRLVYAISVSYLNDTLPPGQRVAASGSMNIFFSAGAFLGPLPAAFLMEAIAPAWLYGYLALVTAAAGLFTLRWRRPARPLEPRPA
ncbi:MAG: MFS transporter [Alphaproteobacteria bacterium]